MARKLVLVLLVVGSVLLAGCGPSDSGNTSAEAVAPTSTPVVDSDGGAVTDMTTELTEAVVTGPACKYGLAISFDVQVKLAHYQICAPAAGEEQKKANAYQQALSDCFEACDENCPDEGSSKTQANLDCVARCKGK